MKRVLKLLSLELWFLKKTVLSIGIILIAFVSALLSVVSVLIDVPDGIYAGLDEYSAVFRLDVTSPARNLSLEGGMPAFGHIDGITRYCSMTGPAGTVFLNSHAATPPNSDEKDGDEKTEQQAGFTFNAYAVMEESAEALFAPYCEYSKKLIAPKAQGELLLNSSLAKMVGAKVGDTVTFAPDPFFEDPAWGLDLSDVGPMSFTVVGLADTSVIGNYNKLHPRENVLPAGQIFFIAPPNAQFSIQYFAFRHSKDIHNAYLSLAQSGTVSKMDGATASLINNIGIAQAFFGAVVLVLALMVIFMLYALISIFYRQRRSQICRLKLLGAPPGVIAGVYCTIAVMLVFIAVLIGSAVSMGFNVYFIGLCGQLFKRFSSNFVSHFRPIVPLGVFAVLVLVTLLLYLHFNRKVKNTAIAQEVRYE